MRGILHAIGVALKFDSIGIAPDQDVVATPCLGPHGERVARDRKSRLTIDHDAVVAADAGVVHDHGIAGHAFGLPAQGHVIIAAAGGALQKERIAEYPQPPPVERQHVVAAAGVLGYREGVAEDLGEAEGVNRVVAAEGMAGHRSCVANDLERIRAGVELGPGRLDRVVAAAGRVHDRVERRRTAHPDPSP